MVKAQWFRDLPIIGKIGLAMAPLVGALLAVGWVYQAVLAEQGRGHSRLDDYVQAQALAREIEICMLEARRSEKDFLMRKDRKYAEKNAQEVRCVLAKAEALRHLGQTLGEETVVLDAERIRESVSGYDAAFKQVETAWLMKGLDAESGQQGAFRKAAHRLETALGDLDTATMWRLLLELRRDEKDLVVRGEERYRERFGANLGTMRQEVQNTSLSPGLKEQFQQRLEVYAKAVYGYAEARLWGETVALGDPRYRAMSETARAVEGLLESHYVEDVWILYLTLRRHEKDYLLRGEESYLKKAEATLSLLTGNLGKSRLAEDERQKLLKLLEVYRGSLFDLAGEDKKLAVAGEAMRRAIHAVEPLIEAVVRRAAEVRSVRAEALSARSREGEWWARGVAVAVGVGGVIFSLLVALSISRSLRRVADYLVGIGQRGEGDLTFRLPEDRRDELGRLSCGFNLFLTCLEGSIRSIDLQSRTIDGNVTALNNLRADIMGGTEQTRAAADNVFRANRRLAGETGTIQRTVAEAIARMVAMNQAAEGLTANIRSIDEASGQSNDMVGVVAAAVTQASAELSEVNTHLVAVNAQVTGVAAAVEGLSAALSQVEERSRTASHHVLEANRHIEATGQTMTELGRAAGEISKVVEVINSIAEQTNMLALNAAIEAAGAGEAGKGFAVVANEVKELARQTAEATWMISEQIQGIQDRTRGADQAVRGVSGLIRELSQLSEEIAGDMAVQRGTVAGVARSMKEVEGASSEVTASSQEMALALREVSRAAEESRRSSEVSSQAAARGAAAALVVVREVQEVHQEVEGIGEAAHRTANLAGEVLEDVRRVHHQAVRAQGISEAFGHVIDLTTSTAHALRAIRNRMVIDERGMFNISDLKSDFLDQFRELEVALRGGGAGTAARAFDDQARHDNSLARWIKGEGGQLFPGSEELRSLDEDLGRVYQLAREMTDRSTRFHQVRREAMEREDAAALAAADAGLKEVQEILQAFLGVHHRIFLLLDHLFHGEWARKGASQNGATCLTMGIHQQVEIF